MAEAWDADLPHDLAWARRWIALSRPDLAALPVEPFGEGFDNAAYRVGDLVFRFPRRRFAVPLLEAEVRFLPAIAARLPVATTVPVVVGRDDAGHPFAAYRVLEGSTACRAGLDGAARAALAVPLGEALRALHADAGRDLPEDQLRRADPAHRLAFARERIARIARHDEALAAQAEAVLAATAAALTTPAERLVCVHGDLYPRHLIVAEGRLVGIIDWGDLHRGDPALDLGAAAAFLPPAAWPAFWAAYGGVDAAPGGPGGWGKDWARACFRATWHTCATLAYGLAIGDAALLAEGRVALGHLAQTYLDGGGPNPSSLDAARPSQ